jgi:hypothetical protein
MSLSMGTYGTWTTGLSCQAANCQRSIRAQPKQLPTLAQAMPTLRLEASVMPYRLYHWQR